MDATMSWGSSYYHSQQLRRQGALEALVARTIGRAAADAAASPADVRTEQRLAVASAHTALDTHQVRPRPPLPCAKSATWRGLRGQRSLARLHSSVA